MSAPLMISKFAPGALILAEQDLTKRRIVGWGSTFEPPERADLGGDIIAMGAYDGSVQRHRSGVYRVKMRDEHGRIVGVWQELSEESKGLRAVGYVSKTQQGDDLLTHIADGAVDSLSVQGRVEMARFLEGTERWGFGGMPVREILKVWLSEISPTGTPMNIYARIEEVEAAKSMRAAEYRDWRATHAPAPDLTGLDERLERIARANENLRAQLRGLTEEKR